MGLKKTFIGILVLIFLAAIFTGCSRAPNDAPAVFPVAVGRLLENPLPTKTPFQPVPWTPTPTIPPPTPTPTPPPYSIWLDPALPAALTAQLTLPADIGRAEQPEGATYRLEVGAEQPRGGWIYALVAPFPTVTDEIAAQDLLDFWKTGQTALFEGQPLLMDESTFGVLAAFWGLPAEGAVQVVPEDEILSMAWSRRPSWGIIPFEQLNPQWKVLLIDGQAPIRKDFNPEEYALRVPISLIGAAPSQPVFPASNYDPDKLTTIALTGVTALVRATAFAMEQQGVLYPAQDIAAWLQAADITHISNEVPFAEDCPYPNPVQAGMVFCSAEKYIELLEYVGTDVVELTGDHFSDWGPEAMLLTLDMYTERGWPYYGGGATLAEGQQVVKLEHNGNRIAFLGCNGKGGGYARASDTNPGAVYCNFDLMQSQIRELRAENYLPIATFQHFEYYTYAAQPIQISDAQKLTSAGAAIVSGSQAHHPQAFEIGDGYFVHHGLGNLFFDQLDVSTGARQGFIDRHVIYDGRHISTELLTIWFVDYARARPMTAEERTDLLMAVFNASGY